MGLGCHSNGSWHWWRGTANPTSSTNKSYVMEYNGSTWAFTGSITATAAITAKATSDFRLKRELRWAYRLPRKTTKTWQSL